MSPPMDLSRAPVPSLPTDTVLEPHSKVVSLNLSKKEANLNADRPMASSAGKFEIGDMVWGKVEPYPWWPGQIYDETLVTDSVRNTKVVEGYVLLAFFGDETYGWFDPSQLRPLEPHFLDNSRQSSTSSYKLFLSAVAMAVDESARRGAIALTCPCSNHVNNFPPRPRPAELFPAHDLVEEEEEHDAVVICTERQIEMARNGFEPDEALLLIRGLAARPPRKREPNGGIDYIKNFAFLLAYRIQVYEDFDCKHVKEHPRTQCRAIGSLVTRSYFGYVKAHTNPSEEGVEKSATTHHHHWTRRRRPPTTSIDAAASSSCRSKMSGIGDKKRRREKISSAELMMAYAPGFSTNKLPPPPSAKLQPDKKRSCIDAPLQPTVRDNSSHSSALQNGKARRVVGKEKAVLKLRREEDSLPNGSFDVGKAEKKSCMHAGKLISIEKPPKLPPPPEAAVSKLSHLATGPSQRAERAYQPLMSNLSTTNPSGLQNGQFGRVIEEKQQRKMVLKRRREEETCASMDMRKQKKEISLHPGRSIGIGKPAKETQIATTVPLPPPVAAISPFKGEQGRQRLVSVPPEREAITPPARPPKPCKLVLMTKDKSSRTAKKTMEKGKRCLWKGKETAKPKDQVEIAKKKEPSPEQLEASPTWLEIKFPPQMAIPSLSELNLKFVRFGKIDPGSTGFCRKASARRILFKHKADAEAALESAAKTKLLGEVKVRYSLSKLQCLAAESSESKSLHGGARPGGAAVVIDGNGGGSESRPQLPLKSCLKKPSDNRGALAGAIGEVTRVRSSFDQYGNIDLLSNGRKSTAAPPPPLSPLPSSRAPPEVVGYAPPKHDVMHYLPPLQLKSCLKKPRDNKRALGSATGEVTRVIRSSFGQYGSIDLFSNGSKSTADPPPPLSPQPSFQAPPEVVGYAPPKHDVMHYLPPPPPPGRLASRNADGMQHPQIPLPPSLMPNLPSFYDIMQNGLAMLPSSSKNTNSVYFPQQAPPQPQPPAPAPPSFQDAMHHRLPPMPNFSSGNHESPGSVGKEDGTDDDDFERQMLSLMQKCYDIIARIRDKVGRSPFDRNLYRYLSQR